MLLINCDRETTHRRNAATKSPVSLYHQSSYWKKKTFACIMLIGLPNIFRLLHYGFSQRQTHSLMPSCRRSAHCSPCDGNHHKDTAAVPRSPPLALIRQQLGVPELTRGRFEYKVMKVQFAAKAWCRCDVTKPPDIILWHTNTDTTTITIQRVLFADGERGNNGSYMQPAAAAGSVSRIR
jgi:hypothetical protein